MQHFLHGVLLIAPLAITIATVHWIFSKVDGLLRPYVELPGLGFVLVLAFVLLVGWIGSFFVIERLFQLFDAWLEHTPGVNFIYSVVRDFFAAFVGRKRRFNRAVLVNVFAEEVWLVGFLTDESLQDFNLCKQYVSVYVPQAYNIAGQLYLVKRERVRPMEQLPASDAMKYAATGGAVEVNKTKED